MLDVPVKILDASYGLPCFPESVLEAMEAARIPDAQFFNIDDIADPAATYQHSLPDADLFAEKIGALGISNDDHVVVYDQNGIAFAAARAWWMFRVMGHENVSVLNGGLPAWANAGLPLQAGPLPSQRPTLFKAHFRPELYRSFEQMEVTTDTILDARSSARFEAQARTMDGDIVPAHIPHSFNVPYQSLLDPLGRSLKPRDELLAILAPYMDAERVVCTCGSGVTACVIALAFAVCGRSDIAVYDGSWTEWADRQGLR